MSVSLSTPTKQGYATNSFANPHFGESPSVKNFVEIREIKMRSRPSEGQGWGIASLVKNVWQFVSGGFQQTKSINNQSVEDDWVVVSEPRLIACSEATKDVLRPAVLELLDYCIGKSQQPFTERRANFFESQMNQYIWKLREDSTDIQYLQKNFKKIKQCKPQGSFFPGMLKTAMDWKALDPASGILMAEFCREMLQKLKKPLDQRQIDQKVWDREQELVAMLKRAQPWSDLSIVLEFDVQMKQINDWYFLTDLPLQQLPSLMTALNMFDLWIEFS